MLWCIHCIEAEEVETLRTLNGKAHGEYLRSGKIRILLAGPLFDKTRAHHQGSLFIVESESHEAVVAFFHEDPFNRAGMWSSVIIQAFRCSTASEINLTQLKR